MKNRFTALEQKNKLWIILILSIILFISLGMLVTPERAVTYPKYTTISPSPTGTKAFYTMLKESNIATNVWKKPIYSAPEIESEQLMIMIQPENQSFDEEEALEWLNWIEQGNSLWLIVENNPNQYFRIETSSNDKQIKDFRHTIKGTAGVNGTFHGWVNNQYRILPSRNDQVLLSDRFGAIATARKYGKGELMVLLAPNWFTNEGILMENHLEMILPLIKRAKPDIIWVNEYIHGFEEGQPVIEVYPKWFVLTIAQGGLVLLLWLWYKGKRFGPIITPREWVVRYGDERIRAISSWYLKGAFYKESLLNQKEYFLHIVQEKWGISTNSEHWIEIAGGYLNQERQNQWKEFFNDFQNIIQRKRISQKDYLKWSKLIDGMRKEVEQK